MKNIFTNFLERITKAIFGEWKTISFFKLLEGDYVRVAVGFNRTKQEGVIRERITSDQDNYVWIDTLDSYGNVIKSFTASADYCIFEIKR